MGIFDCFVYIYSPLLGRGHTELLDSVTSEVPVCYHFNWHVISVMGLFLIVKMSVSKQGIVNVGKKKQGKEHF